MNAEVENVRIPSILQHLPSKQDLFEEIYGSDDLRFHLSKQSALFVSLKSLVLMSCISGTKGCQIAAFPLFIKNQGRYLGQYASN